MGLILRENSQVPCELDHRYMPFELTDGSESPTGLCGRTRIGGFAASLQPSVYPGDLMSEDRMGELTMGRWGLVLAGWILGMGIEPVWAEQVYKLQISSTGGGGLSLPVPLPVPLPIDTSRQEWVVITVVADQVTLLHTTSVVNLIGLRTWHDHPATSVRLCRSQGFDQVDCATTPGDTATLPQGASIYDVVIEFKYVEGGLIQTQRFQLAREVQPDPG